MDEREKTIKKTVEERSKLISKKKLYYGCLEPMTKEHNAKNCKQKLTCKTCVNSHPTVTWIYQEGLKTSITVKTFNGEEAVKAKAIKDLKVAQIGNEDKKCWSDLPKHFQRDSFPVDSEEIVTPDQIKKWGYLDGIATSIPDKNVEVGLIIGVNCVKALEPLEFIPIRKNGPYAYKISLG